MFEIGLSETPVIRDGLTTGRSYVILACKPHEKYNCVVWGVSSQKLKFYPDAEFWGVTDGVLAKCGIHTSFYSRSDYIGVVNVQAPKLEPLLDYLSNQRGTHAVDAETFLEWAKSKQPRDNVRHPYTNGVPPAHSFPAWSGQRAS